MRVVNYIHVTCQLRCSMDQKVELEMTMDNRNDMCRVIHPDAWKGKTGGLRCKVFSCQGGRFTFPFGFAGRSGVFAAWQAGRHHGLQAKLCNCGWFWGISQCQIIDIVNILTKTRDRDGRWERPAPACSVLQSLFGGPIGECAGEARPCSGPGSSSS